MVPAPNMAVVSRSGRGPSAAKLAVLASWLSTLVEGQGFYGGDQTVCGPSNDYRYLGCYPGNLVGAGKTFPFSPGQYVPGVDPSASYPGWDPGSHFNNTVTPYTCQTVCRGHDFKYAAFQNGACYCGLLPPSGGATGTDCAHYCSDDDFQTCGGADTDVYADPSFADPVAVTAAGAATLRSYYKYLGCYYAPRFNTQNALVSETCQTDVDVCYEHCATNGYPFAAAIWNDPADVASICGWVDASLGSGFLSNAAA